MHVPEVTEYIKTSANRMDEISDKVDEVNQLKYDEESKFDSEKDKTGFRQYEEACDRVKNFYAVSFRANLGHRLQSRDITDTPPTGAAPQADSRVQHRHPQADARPNQCSHVGLGSDGDAQHPR